MTATPADPLAHDRRRIYACAFLRALATGMTGILLGLYLARTGLTASSIGTVVGAGLAGAAVAALLATVRGDRHGRRRFLAELAVLSALGAAAAALVHGEPALLAAAFFGMLNGMGRDRGAALILEQAALPGTTTEANRTRVFAWYNVVQDCGNALGALFAGLPTLLEHAMPLAAPETPFRLSFGVVALLSLAALPLYATLSPAVESANPGRRAPISPHARKLLLRICPLFALDSLGGGFLTASLVSYFFAERFHTGAAALGALFFGARVLNALSHLGAAWLSKRIGLVNTMVFTHIPSSLLLVSVAFAPSFAVAAVLFLLREGLVEMDVPTRQSYVMAVTEPEERTVVSGVTHLVRVAAWAVAPFLAGALMQDVSLLAPLVLGAALKILYDVLLYFAFRNLPPPEERRAATA